MFGHHFLLIVSGLVSEKSYCTLIASLLHLRTTIAYRKSPSWFHTPYSEKLLFRTRSWVGLHHVYDPSRCMGSRFLDYQQCFCLKVASFILALYRLLILGTFTRGDGHCPFYAVQHQSLRLEPHLSNLAPTRIGDIRIYKRAILACSHFVGVPRCQRISEGPLGPH